MWARLAAQHHQQIGDHLRLAFLAHLDDRFGLQPPQRLFDHGHRTLDNLGPGRDHRGRLLALQHRVGDLRSVRERRNPRLHHFQAGNLDPGRNLLGEFSRNQLSRAPQRLFARLGIVVRVAGGDVAQRGLGLNPDEVFRVLDREGSLGGVGDLPDNDRRDRDRVTVSVVDLELVGLEVVHLH